MPVLDFPGPYKFASDDMNDNYDSVASHPFDDTSTASDVILVSSDKVAFHTHKSILSLASPFFKDMFTLPQPVMITAKPVISMAEDSEMLDKILRFCYPAVDPSFASLTELNHVLTIMVRKYLMDDVARRARNELRKYVQEEPLRVFAIAYSLQWSEEIDEAVKWFLSRPLLSDARDIAELDALDSARVLFRLLQFHRECSMISSFCAKDHGFVASDVQFLMSESAACTLHDELGDPEDPFLEPRKTWLIEYCNSIAKELRSVPSMHTLRHGDCESEEWARQVARQVAFACPDCSKNSLDEIFDMWIPQFYLTRIEGELAQVCSPMTCRTD
ncbi:hypothetical protein EDD85DRAFT_175915 [Armillaria nabsnona]|nr:hypothetical protein EDD85DRAFT_175915 [Armillaria nabsnona]